MGTLGPVVKISVVIPTHNRLDGLASAIFSLSEQTVRPDEIIVIDDGSDQAVPASIFQGFPADVRTVLIRNETPKGGNHARNRGVLSATGDYIAFLDDDDTFKPKKIELLKKSAQENPSVDLIYHPAHIHMVNEGVSYFSKPKKFESDEEVFRRLLVSNLIGGTPMVTVRRTALLHAGLFDENMPALQDYELWIRLAKNNYRFYFLNEPLTNYVHKTKSSSITKNSDAIERARMILDGKYRHVLTEAERRVLRRSRLKSDVLRFSLNGNMVSAFRKSVNAFWVTKDKFFLVSALSSLMGQKIFFKLFMVFK